MSDEKPRSDWTVAETLHYIQTSRSIGAIGERPKSEAAKAADRARKIADGTYDPAQDKHPTEMTVDDHVRRLQARGGRP